MKTIKKNSFSKTAIALFNEGNYKAATEAFKLKLANNQSDTTALFHLALSLYELGQFRRSLKYWKRLKEINPQEENLHLNMGCIYQNLGRNDLAIVNFKKELEINPVSGETLYSLGTLYYNLHRYTQAVGYLERCLSLKHSIEPIIYRLAYSYFKTGQIDREITLYQDYLKSHPNDTWCLNNIGAALMHLGEYNRAQLYLQKLGKLDSKDKVAMKNLKKVQQIRESLYK